MRAVLTGAPRVLAVLPPVAEAQARAVSAVTRAVGAHTKSAALVLAARALEVGVGTHADTAVHWNLNSTKLNTVAHPATTAF